MSVETDALMNQPERVSEAQIGMCAELFAFWTLPRKYKLILISHDVDRCLEQSRPFYELLATGNGWDHSKARAKWLEDALRNNAVSYQNYQRGRLLDDLRDYRLRCNLFNFPMCCEFAEAIMEPALLSPYSFAPVGVQA